MAKGVVTFGRDESQRLAAQISTREITVCEDETFHPQTCFVAIEPVSTFILLECYAEGRSAAIWAAAFRAAVEGLRI